MPGRVTYHCSQRERTEALASDGLSGDERSAAQTHLEECETCRTLFRQQTAERFPRFRNYTILERMGEGGFGVVYKVIHHAKQRTEALKALFGKTPLREAYFQNEVHLIAKLRHPNIATLYEAHLNSPPLYYAMEFVEGKQLDDYLRSQHVPLAERIRIVKTVAEAIGYAHQQGVIHRDIKPQNVIVDAQGQPHIVDFGIAKKLGLEPVDDDAPPPSPEGFVGTFGYIAPEQAAGGPVDARADIYALGALLYHCITGEPAKFANRAQRLTQLLHERQVAHAADLAAIIARCVDPVPEQRYKTCLDLVKDLDDYLSGRPIRARHDPTPAYRTMRRLALLLRTRPLTVRTFIVILVASLLTVTARWAEARWFVPGTDQPSVKLVTITGDTRRAFTEGRLGPHKPGLDLKHPKAFRLLQGRLMERLAEARPAAVIWDGYFPDCHPQFDDGLLAGIEALNAVGVPVVIGVGRFDINSEPESCRRILDAVHGWGLIASTEPKARGLEYLVPVCARRGFARPVPSLGVAGFAAARRPNAQVDLEVRPNTVLLRYRKPDVPPGQSRWHESTDSVRYGKVEEITKPGGPLRPGDLVYLMQVRADQDHDVSVPRIAIEDVLSADRARLQHWFTGSAVVIGNTIPGQDEHPTRSGGNVFGCEIQAQTIEALLSGGSLLLYERPTLTLTILLWAVVAAAMVGLLPCSRTASLAATAWMCVTACVVGILVVLCVAVALTDFWQVQVGIAAGTLLATGGPTYLAKAIRNRQIHLAPELIWEIEDATIATTLLATASDDDGSTHQESVTGSTRARPATSLALPDQHTTPPGPPAEKHSSARR